MTTVSTDASTGTSTTVSTAASADTPPLKIGYLLNAYPMTSTTFIRREIHALEAQGHDVTRYAIRPWDTALVDPQDIEEQARTQYLLSGRTKALLADFFREAAANPRGILSALKAWGRLVGNARGGVIRHAAYFLEAISLKRAAKRDGIAHIHAHFSTNSAAVALLAHRLGGPEFSFMVHGPDELIDWGPASLKFKTREARFVAAISHFCRTQVALAAGYDQWDKIHIVHCGIDMDEFPASNAPFDARAPFVCVGRLCPQKAQLLIVEAAAKVALTHRDMHIEFIGDGDIRPQIEALIAQHGLQENVTLLGWKTNAEVRAHLGAARALLLPSFAEGLPVVIMEALALGRPAISTYIAGIPELVDDNVGWIIPAGSVDDIAQAMRAAMDAAPKTLTKMGTEGRARVMAHHDAGANAALLAKHIHAAVTSKT